MKVIPMTLRTVFFTMVCLVVTALHAEQDMNKHTGKCVTKNGINDCKMSAVGSINLAQTNGKYNAKNIFLKMNNKMDGELRLYHEKAKGTDFVRGEFALDNMSSQKLFVKYRVILKDKKGIVAQTAGYIHLTDGRRQKKKISYIELRKQDIKNIASYEIKIDASNKEH